MTQQELKDYLDSEYWQSLRKSRFIQLNPADTHSVWAQIIDSQASGLTVVITRVAIYAGVGGYTPSVGEVHYYPLSKLRYKHVTEEDATAQSTNGYRR
jgi:hypothetical protein